MSDTQSNATSSSSVPYLRCIEFFSGIGGYHFALTNSLLKGEILKAFDTNEIANKVYQNCFGAKPSNRVINVLTAKELDKFNANCWLMSPPCQPYTRGGKQLDLEDNRTQALKNLINLLPQLKAKPEFIMLENVVNFETSQSRDLLIEELKKLNYNIIEYLVTPIDIGVPNERPRYFLMARLLPFTPRLNQYVDKFVRRINTDDVDSNTKTEIKEDTTEESKGCDTALKSILESESEDLEDYLVPEKWILKSHNFRFDIVNPESYRTSCFTKNTPEEAHWIPRDTKYKLDFPKDVSKLQRYKLLGNSLNVSLVQKLMEWYWKDEINASGNEEN
ncbi:S-adenosyl-L-methionine-dependent methyltransferase [Conidiobolus coronatus NRRL 28638]|uniref:S-adenosyl-L-methionine-dependent methyltransferase n=1 Tax=Conidiobolus coronatus (strain ATCC 28846 / CBS 209.66 / NRRL 28638) TaxID=796925 RepID=A0A137NRE2_CONC2|nr:S-adenosyl-L-methionine-dependent methyltransferase [Conidiobolus coronatus NRRL 28638]|eukprot:KXN65305.1 S-adenosyl-L-methionine-dependent methyltransferase [Conidiobolus coronatus NRRL 28638]